MTPLLLLLVMIWTQGSYLFSLQPLQELILESTLASFQMNMELNNFFMLEYITTILMVLFKTVFHFKGEKFIVFFLLDLPHISSLQLVISSDVALALNCTSTSSPAADIVWRKDGSGVTNDTFITTTQILRNGVSATYDNILTINAPPYELIGKYSCIVHDSLGRNSESSTIQVNGM